jgi:hypothetical protein
MFMLSGEGVFPEAGMEKPQKAAKPVETGLAGGCVKGSVLELLTSFGTQVII